MINFWANFLPGNILFWLVNLQLTVSTFTDVKYQDFNLLSRVKCIKSNVVKKCQELVNPGCLFVFQF